ncbi:MAG: ABC transporter permease [Caldiserica bacterium]|jgi:ABC-2 type transport system permease protein|nr:ABC transporter permease [Caldisericota bacterium]MDH7562815.1 ABC transporter permease [Caldisericota bacterium]
MALDRVFALALRIIQQFLRDKRTLALIFIVPVVVMGLLAYLISSPNQNLEIGLSLPSGFPLEKVIQQNLETYGLKSRIIAQEEAIPLLQKGEIQAALFIPPEALNPSSLKGAEIKVILEGSDPSTTSQIMEKLSLAFRDLISQIPGGAGFPNLVPEFLYGGEGFDIVDYLAPVFISFFVFFFVFLLSVVSFLRERTRGTMERLLVSPIERGEIILGYALGFLIFALIQSLIVLLFGIYVLGIQYRGSLWLVYLVNLFVIFAAVSLGIFLSSFARNEFQAIQFIPIVIIPQALLSGFFWPVEQLAPVLRVFSYAMPMTYATWALKGVMIKGQGFGEILVFLLALCGFTIFFFLLAGISIKRAPE